MHTRAENRILQSELREVEELAPAQKRYTELRRNIIERLDTGASVEPGDLTAQLTFHESRQLSWPRLEAILGGLLTGFIRTEIVPIRTRRLVVTRRDTPSRHERKRLAGQRHHSGQSDFRKEAW